MRLFSLILILGLSLVLGACNTVHGFGKDLQKVGEKISDKSEPSSKH